MQGCELASDQDQDTIEKGLLEDTDTIIVNLVFSFI